MTKPEFWPNGADPELVRECSCSHCAKLIEALEAWQEGQAPDGQNQTLERFA